MSLNERKLKILEAIINDYIGSAEAVGSRTISKKYDLGISAATIRNEMSDLEELGYLIQPHTSAGRIPSEKGYKLYVDTLMKCTELDSNAKGIIESHIKSNMGQVRDLLDETLKLLSMLTNCTAIAITPQPKERIIRHLQLVYINKSNMLLIIVCDDSTVKNIPLINSINIPKERVEILSKILCENLEGKMISDLDEGFINYIKSEIVNYNNALDALFDNIVDNIIQIDELNITLNGTTNIFNFPEFNDVLKAKAFLDMLEQKSAVIDILNSQGIRKDNLNVIIGSENTYDIAKNCSVITVTCGSEDAFIGKIGIIGPTRMDYSKFCSIINYLGTILSNILKGT